MPSLEKGERERERERECNCVVPLFDLYYWWSIHSKVVQRWCFCLACNTCGFVQNPSAIGVFP
jgi:hypothetical protein